MPDKPKISRIKLKVCGMLDPQNIMDVALFKPDFLGFIFYPKSPRYVGGKLDPDVLNKLPNSILKTGVFVNEKLNTILENIRLYGLNAIQLHGEEPPEFAQELKSYDVKVIKTFRVTDDFNPNDVVRYVGKCEFFLFDTYTKSYGGSGKSFNWEILKNLPSNTPYILSGGIGPEEVAKLNISELELLYALDINSKVEIGPGLKDLKKVAQVAKKLDRLNKKLKEENT